MKCYVCEGSDFISVEGKVRDLPNLGIRRCKACGLVFLENFDHVDDRFYEDSQMRVNRDVIDWKIYKEQSLMDDTRRFQWIKEKALNKSVLDFGCGAGGFLSQVKRTAIKCSGVEKDKMLRRRIQEEYNIHIYSDVGEISEKFDIITLFHVLEHFKDPKELLMQLSNLLEDDGRIIIEVPNSDDALLSFYKSKAFSEFTYWGCHLYLFNIGNLKLLMEKAGLKIDFIKQIQRYPLSNHLYWLAEGKPGGHNKWNAVDTDELNKAYERSLATLGIGDTIMASVFSGGNP
jgi:2-polyprenyl-3-methyl-5-hydroxy-6-metoxy-1,4-benzoquinol methylase